ncbi:unnamed protein product [Effrenium voratum]|nr:unnamed protein product [Effrenium voratum]
MEPDEDDEEELRAEVDRLREACERHLEEAERQQRAADQANRRVEEQEKELGQLEDVVAGLEAQLREAQALGSRQGSELQAAKDQVASLERELGEEANSHSRRRIGRSKTEALKTASPEEAQQLETKREHEEAYPGTKRRMFGGPFQNP